MQITLRIEKLDSHDKDVLCDIYETLENSKRLEVFMYSDSSLQAFLAKFYKQWLYACYVDDVFAGFTAFDSFQGKAAFFHFCMLPLGDKHSLDFGRMIFDTVFRNDNLLTVFGMTPLIFRHVFATLNDIGFEKIQAIKQVCRIRGKLRDGVLSSLTKENFYNINKEFIKQ